MKKFLVLISFTLLLSSCKTDPTEGYSVVIIHTEYGDMKAILYNDTPAHRDNFLKLSKEKYYDGTKFHRVIKGFMIQGGDPLSKDTSGAWKIWGTGGPNYNIRPEIFDHHPHVRGALAAARMPLPINPKGESSGSQFYIVQGTKVNDEMLKAAELKIKEMDIENFVFTPEVRKKYLEKGGYPYLDGQYSVFGEVIEGLDVIDSICNLPLRETKIYNTPVEDVPMTITVVKEVLK